LVSVAAGEVVHIGVMILGGTPARPSDKGGEAVLPGKLAGGRLACIVFNALDPHSTPFNTLLGVLYSRMMPRSAPNWQSCCRLQYSYPASEIRRHARYAKPTTTIVPLTVSSPHQLYEEAGKGQNHSPETPHQ
jgi:hypothetical protein